ncbi:hypothetical protein CHUAL_007500 [Chamberlinius hualienensis]
MGSNQDEKLDVNKLSLPQLTQYKQQLDQEIELFSNSLQQLKIAQTKFQESGECLEKITPANEGKEILVPLTGSMYVPGFLGNVSNVLIDVGTGYFAEKGVDSAKDYFKRKMKFVTEQMDMIQSKAQEKVRERESVMEILETKIQAQLAAQQPLSSLKP